MSKAKRSGNGRIVEFFQIEVTRDQLLSLPDNDLSFLASGGLAYNNLIVFFRLCILHRHELNEDSRDIESSFVTTNSSILFRYLALSSLELMKRCRESAETCSNQKLRSNMLKHLDAHRNSPQFQVARDIRNDMAGHMNLKQVRTIVESFPAKETFSFYLRNEDGNSLNHISEKIGMLGRFNNISEVAEYYHWVLQLAHDLIAMFNQLVAEIAAARFPGDQLISRKAVLPASLIATTEHFSPILLIDDDKHLSESRRS